MSHRLHVLKIPTTRASESLRESLFPYTHYADVGHDPRMTVERRGESGAFVLRCVDRFKLKPNYMRRPANRVDIYMPGGAAASLAIDIIEIAGAGDMAQLANVDPEAARLGPQTLPVIRATRAVECVGFRTEIAGLTIHGGHAAVYIDDEAPREGHIEMLGPEVHLGIQLDSVTGEMEMSQVDRADLWRSGPREAPTAVGDVRIAFNSANGSRLAAALLHFSRAHELEAAALRG